MLEFKATARHRIRQREKRAHDHFAAHLTDTLPTTNPHTENLCGVADSISVNRDLFALITSDDHRSLAALARAIRVADRNDHLPIWRSFVTRAVSRPTQPITRKAFAVPRAD